VVQAGLAPFLEVAGVHPNLVLVAVVLVTTIRGLGAGLTWAFVAGLAANLLTTAPLGSIPLAMLAVTLVIAGVQQLLGRLSLAVPLIAALCGSVLADAIELVVLRLLDQAPAGGIPASTMVAAALLNAGLVALLLYPARRLVTRLPGAESPSW